MERIKIETHCQDYQGNPISITCEGVDDQKIAHFGGLDLTVKAARIMIGATYGPMAFPEKNGDSLIAEKVVGMLLNEIGELIRSKSFDSDTLENYSNIDLIKGYIEDLAGNKDLQNFIESDEADIREYRMRLREDEDRAWGDFNKKFGNE